MNTQPMHPQASGEGRAQQRQDENNMLNPSRGHQREAMVQEEQSEQLFQTVWETAIEAMVLSDPDGIVHIANPAYYRLYGYTPEEVLGKDFAIIFPEAQRPWARQRYQERFRDPIIRPPAESSVLRADGTERLVESSYSFIVHNETRVAMLSIVHDITDRKRLEELNYEQAQELAIARERQRLARELHDSVSQLLFGIALSVQMAREALDEAETAQALDALGGIDQYVKAAKAEVRALLYELRLESLETEGLVLALTKQAAALQARHELVVATHLCDEPNLSLRVKQELYRIAQEAMHNTVKHARASQVTLRLQQGADEVVLEVQDDGIGFDPSATFPGHLGLHSMRERVTNLDGAFLIASTAGQGTTIRVQVPVGA